MSGSAVWLVAAGRGRCGPAAVVGCLDGGCATGADGRRATGCSGAALGGRAAGCAGAGVDAAGPPGRVAGAGDAAGADDAGVRADPDFADEVAGADPVADDVAGALAPDEPLGPTTCPLHSR
ncbi:MAG: hypothetical protein KF809_11075 [Chloroflexi bacterium]|nr:hypothetical protein [Chloroflexota bacterium]